MSQPEVLEGFGRLQPAIDFREWEFLRRKDRREPVWWVAMLINIKTGGHTQLQKTTDPAELLARLPIRENDKEWHEGIFVQVGSARAAEAFIQLVSGSYQTDAAESKQIRGIISRAAMAQLLIERYGLRAHGNFNNILCVENAEQLLEKRPL